ncbi:flagellar export chaperone FliS [Uliginosibacterium sp. H3]|uniref:Flagellar secretion chaperone FliS n=1 Tax=Uliginosibacterium silvisoli TaxID=3114758 RepID=A0ABU6K9D1_9RHOO|nr:flagellar export chaperone FliS [Uliginosibacterium sp. H3]
MFATQSAAAYAKVGIETNVTTANPHQLVLMLFDGALLAINSAAISMSNGDVAAKGSSISKAIEIVTFGLKASLDSESGGDLAIRLGSLYDYVCQRLFFANTNNNEAALTEVSTLLTELREAWAQIGQQVQDSQMQAG